MEKEYKDATERGTALQIDSKKEDRSSPNRPGLWRMGIDCWSSWYGIQSRKPTLHWSGTDEKVVQTFPGLSNSGTWDE
tara:strand:- start:308 stop:541 length:234 start_codon:yes stop_codon:yes gene_type:complete